MTLRDALYKESVTHLDLSRYCLVESGTTVRETFDNLRTCKSNCAFVIKNDKLAGIFTERDVLRKAVDRPDLWEQPVDTLMSVDLQTLSADATAVDALELMENNNFRNVPVLDADGSVVGNLTHYSILEFLASSFPLDIYNRPPDATLISNRRHGG